MFFTLTPANKFTPIIKNQFDSWFQKEAFNTAKGMRILLRMAV